MDLIHSTLLTAKNDTKGAFYLRVRRHSSYMARPITNASIQEIESAMSKDMDRERAKQITQTLTRKLLLFAHRAYYYATSR